MVNFSAFSRAREKYTAAAMPFLTELKEKVQKEQPYRGLTILHNLPLTIEAVLKAEVLLVGGAEVTMSCITTLDPDPEALEILNAADVNVQLSHNFTETYDFHLDCCGELLQFFPPRRGAVELTQTGSALYKAAQVGYPVISVDDSEIKLLETIFGTGNGFIRALQNSSAEPIYDKKFMVFGYGKVGRGIVHSLTKFADRIVVVDLNDQSKKAAVERGIKYIDSKKIDEIKKELRDTFCVVTSTGIPNILTAFYGFRKEDFKGVILTNMGAGDEYGTNFSTEDVFFAKKTFNFSIKEPTTMKYLDPILFAHNLGVDVILSGKVVKGYNPLPKQIDKETIKKWSLWHNEDLSDIMAYFY